MDSWDELPGWSPEVIAQRCGVSVRTARRWRQGGALPPWAAILLRVVLRGELELIDPAWRRWRLIRGELCSPESWCFPPGEVLSIPLLREELHAWQARIGFACQADWVQACWTAPEEFQKPAPIGKAL